MMRNQFSYLMLMFGGALAFGVGLPILVDLISGSFKGFAEYQVALWAGGFALCLIAAIFAGMLLYFRIRHGPRITRRRLDPRLNAEQSIFDGAGLLIVGRFAPDRVLIQDAATRTEIAAHEIRAVSFRERYHAEITDAILFELNDGKIIRRYLQTLDNGAKFRDQIAALLGLQ
jgi:hypothetical protein